MNTGQSLFWSGYARVYDLIWDSPLTRSVNARATAGLGPAGTIVDIGCGTGLSCESMAQTGWDVVGVDLCRPMLARAVAESRVASCINADAASTGLPDGCADAVILSNILHIHPQPCTVLQEASRLLTPGGTIVCVWPAESASFRRAFGVDVRLGRSLGASVVAGVLRIFVGAAGAPVAARRRSSADVAQVIQDWSRSSGMEIVGADAVMGIEEIAHLVQSCSYAGRSGINRRRRMNHLEEGDTNGSI